MATVNDPAGTKPSLISDLRSALGSAEVAAVAERHLERAHSLGLRSDWEGCEKELDFAKLAAAAAAVLPGGGAVETGVARGGTSAVLIQSCAPGSFHVSVDPYGLPTQSYPNEEYGDWEQARATLSRLNRLAEESGVTYNHYTADSRSFIRADLLRHPGRFTVVHLDGDHSRAVVETELEYFLARVPGPAVFVLDDHDKQNPGVGQGLKRFRGELAEIFHREYDFPPYGICGFSAWLRPPDEAAEPAQRGFLSRFARRRRS